MSSNAPKEETPNNQNSSPLMTPDEVAKLLQVHASWVYSHQDELPGIVRLGRYVRFRRKAIAEFLQADLSCEKP